MSYFRLTLRSILLHVLLLLLAYAIFRGLFYAFNYDEIGAVSRAEWGQALQGGLRFDLSAIAFINSLWILLMLIFSGHKPGKVWRRVIEWAFWLPNIVAILFEVSDWVYFRFNRKRATIEIFDLIFTKGDFVSILPGYIVSYWYVPLLATVLIGLLWYGHRKINRVIGAQYDLFEQLRFPKLKGKKYFGTKLVMIALTAGLVVLAMRGGTQLVPVNARNAISYLPVEKIGLVLNTPFSIITSAESSRLKEYEFMSAKEADKLIHPVKQYVTDQPFQRKNVVVIILESFSRVFTGLGDAQSYTPFLDSLSRNSIAYTNAYANGLRSNEGIPAILSGIPAMMQGPIITSVYSNNKFTSIAGLLQEEGYKTAFFHGGTNGSMGFDTYAANAGFEQYFGRYEYHNEKDYDGTWGIYDEPFLQFVSKQLSAMPQPFMGAVFTLSSHPPFSIPAQYAGKFPQGRLGIEASIGYTDYALRRFFETASRQSWYNNTVFVITADHCSPFAPDRFYTDFLGRYQVPVILFDPQQHTLARRDSILVQQIDILPTVMDYLHYHKPFFAFGNSVLDTAAPRYFITNLSGNYNTIIGDWHMKTQETDIKEVYRFPADMKDQQNIFTQVQATDTFYNRQRYLQALLQLFNHSVIHNQMHCETYPINISR
jgi:phosphoglycerol transferase MdoB-like AlkP superfamily enzyme